MKIGMIGLGRMGSGMVRRLLGQGQSCLVYDRSEAAVKAAVAAGAEGAEGLKEMIRRLPQPRVVWLMLPAAAVDGVIDTLIPELHPGDILIDGGNTHYHLDIERGDRLARKGLHYVDVGTSGGVWGERRGYCLMIGGEASAVKRLAPLFEALAPGGRANGIAHFAHLGGLFTGYLLVRYWIAPAR